MPKRLPAIVLTASVLLALAFRVLPGYHAVFTTHGTSFQEPDAWFHMRTIHNLMAHFPRRSGFDPYSLYPGGTNITTGPFWDYLVGTAAWIAAVGKPSDYAVDEAGAWLPAVLGALFPVLVFFTARRLFDTGAAMFSALWVAIIPGTFLWVSHLGMADHHAAEAFTSFLTLSALCAAAETRGRGRWMFSALSGGALAAYLSTRPAGVFVPAILAVAALFNLSLAPAVAAAMATACLLLLPAGGVSPWSNFTWLSLMAGLAITVPIAVLNRIAAHRNWPRGALYRAVIIVGLVSIGCVELLEAAKIRALFEVILSYLPGRAGKAMEGTIQELQPLWRSVPGGFSSLFAQFGAAWIFAIPGLAAIVWMAWRTRRPALTLFAVWSLAMILGVVFQLRMAAYAGLVVAILAGTVSVWIVRRVPARISSLRAGVAGALIIFATAIALPIGSAQTRVGAGPGPDWLAALEWMRWNTPEPMEDRLAWYRWWPRLDAGARFAYPGSAYGILAPWDDGWWISGIARRIPTANGQQDGIVETSRFLTETQPDDALRDIRKSGARYVAIGPESVTIQLPSLVSNAGRRIDQYSRVFDMPVAGGQHARVRVYFPAFYRSMAARLYLFEGRRIDSKQTGVMVFLTSGSEETIHSVRRFASEKEAEQWIAANPYETANLASADPAASCVDLDEIPWLSRVFASSNERVVGGKQPTVVKIFELASDTRR